MPHRTNQKQGGGKSRSESKNKPADKRGAKSAETGRERARIATEQPSYDSLDETRGSGGVGKIEHRADTARMGRKERGASSSSVQSSSISGDVGEAPSRGESRGINEASGGALSDDSDEPVRGSSAPGRARETNDELNRAGFSKPSSERSDEDSGRGVGVGRSSSSPRGQSGSRGQEPTAKGGFIEPNERTSGSSRRR